MSLETNTPTTPTRTSPEHHPTVAISLEAGEQLKAAGRTAEVDLTALNDTMNTVGVPEHKLDTVDVLIRPYSPYIRGFGGISDIEGRYDLQLTLDKQLDDTSVDTMHEAAIHEAQHISDFMETLETTDRDTAEKEDKRNKTLKQLGAVAVGGAAFALTAHLMKANLSPSEWGDPAEMVKNGVAVAQGLAGYYNARQAFYRFSPSERRARKASKEHADSLKPAISFPEK